MTTIGRALGLRGTTGGAAAIGTGSAKQKRVQNMISAILTKEVDPDGPLRLSAASKSLNTSGAWVGPR